MTLYDGVEMMIGASHERTIGLLMIVLYDEVGTKMIEEFYECIMRMMGSLMMALHDGIGVASHEKTMEL